MFHNVLYPFSQSILKWRAENQLPEWVYQQLNKKRLIFTVTTGRSGTGYLATMLNTLPNIAAFHEPEPKFTHWMRALQTQPDVAIYFWLLHKLPAIARINTTYYVETSHLFGKGFFEALSVLDIPFDLILLKRKNREVAKSLFQLNVIPGRTIDGLKFLLSPNDPVLIPLPASEVLHDYQLCYWYTLEMEARGAYYAEQLDKRGGLVANLEFDEIFSDEGIKKLLNLLNIPVTDLKRTSAYQAIKHQKINDKKDMKKRRLELSEEELDTLEKEVLQLTQFYENEVHYEK